MRATRKKDGIRTYSSDRDLVNSRRHEIAEKATRVFVKKGYHETNMRELAAECGMSVGKIYHYVGSKQDILYLIINTAVSRPETWMEDIWSGLRTHSATEILNAFIRGYYLAIDRGQENTLFTYQETKNLDQKSRKTILDAAARDIQACARILQHGVQKGEFCIDNIELCAHHIVVLGHMWAVRRWFLKKVCTLDEYIQDVSHTILTSISASQQRASN